MKPDGWLVAAKLTSAQIQRNSLQAVLRHCSHGWTKEETWELGHMGPCDQSDGASKIT